MPFLPFAGTIGSVLGAGAATSATAAAVGGTALAAGAAAIGTSLASSSAQSKAAKSAAADMAAANSAAMQKVKDAQQTASSTAADSIKRRVASFSKTVYTSPLGLTGQASTARKTLLGQ